MINLLLLKINIPRRKMHSWEKQFKCDHCGKTFLLKTKLTSHHENTHWGEAISLLGQQTRRRGHIHIMLVRL